MGREASWYGLNMLPIYEEMLIDQLNESMARLSRLKGMKENSQEQYNREILQALKIQANQSKDNWVFFEQWVRLQKRGKCELAPLNLYKCNTNMQNPQDLSTTFRCRLQAPTLCEQGL